MQLGIEGSAKQGLCMNSSLGGEDSAGMWMEMIVEKLQGQRKIMKKIHISTHTTFRQVIAFMKSQLEGKGCVCQGDYLK